MTNYLVKVGYQVDSKPLENMTEAADKNAESLNNAAKQTQKYTMSQKQLAAATRGVPAQLTDIAVSLQAGQNPLTVLLQQGGQLKDMFGGIRPAAAALGKEILGLVNPYTVAAAAAISMTYALYKNGAQLSAINQSLVSTGGYVGKTTQDIVDMAEAMDQMSGTTKGSAIEALTAVASSAKISGDNMQLVATAAEQMRNATGKAIEDTISEFIKLQEDPLAAIVKLNESQNFLTESTYENIKSLVEQGKTAEAVRAAFEAYADSIEERSGEIVQNLTFIERKWKDIKSGIAESAEAFSNFVNMTAGLVAGDELTKLAAAQAKVTYEQTRYNDALQRGASPRIIAYQRSKVEAALEEYNGLNATTVALQNKQRAEAKARQEAAARVRYVANADAEYTKVAESNSDKRQRALKAEEIKYNQLRAAAAGNADALANIEAAYQKRIATIKKQYEDPKAPKGRKPPKSAEQKEAEQQARALERALKSVNEAAAQAVNEGNVEKMMQLIRGDAISTNLPERLAAVNQAMSRFGIEITSASTNAQGMLDISYRMSEAKARELGLWNEATNSVNTASKAYQEYMAKARELAGTTEQNVADEQARKLKEDSARVTRDIEYEIEQINARTEIMKNNRWATEEEITALMEEQAYWADIERQVKEGTLQLDEKTLEAMKERRKEAQEANKEETENMKVIQGYYDGFKQSLKSSITDALQTGKFDFKKFLGDIANMLIQSGIDKIFASLFKTDGGGFGGSGGGNGQGGWWNTILSAVGTFFGGGYANGGAFSKGTQLFATGAVVSSPTSFGMAGGKRGVMGEAGPEAIMPLARGPGGKLGVVATGGASNSTTLVVSPGAVIVQTTGDSKADTEATAKAIDKMIEVKFKKLLADEHRPGNSMNRRYGY